jgi:hypothetical protein
VIFGRVRYVASHGGMVHGCAVTVSGREKTRILIVVFITITLNRKVAPMLA